MSGKDEMPEDVKKRRQDELWANIIEKEFEHSLAADAMTVIELYGIPNQGRSLISIRDMRKYINGDCDIVR